MCGRTFIGVCRHRAPILALERIRRDVAAFEVALTEARLRRLGAGSASLEEERRATDLAPFIMRQAVERGRRQGRIKWPSK